MSATIQARETDILTQLTDGLTQDQAAAVSRSFRHRAYAAGAKIITEGDYQDFVYVIESGRAKVSLGKNTVLVAGPGEFLAFDSLFSDTYNKTIVALEDTSVIYSPRDTLLRLMETSPQIAANVIKILNNHARSLEDRIVSFSGGTLQRRLVATLLKLAEDGKPADDGRILVAGATHEFLASIVGASREAVTIALGKLRDSGTVEQVGRGNLLVNVDSLARLSAGE